MLDVVRPQTEAALLDPVHYESLSPFLRAGLCPCLGLSNSLWNCPALGVMFGNFFPVPCNAKNGTRPTSAARVTLTLSIAGRYDMNGSGCCFRSAEVICFGSIGRYGVVLALSFALSLRSACSSFPLWLSAIHCLFGFLTSTSTSTSTSMSTSAIELLRPLARHRIISCLVWSVPVGSQPLSYFIPGCCQWWEDMRRQPS